MNIKRLLLATVIVAVSLGVLIGFIVLMCAGPSWLPPVVFVAILFVGLVLMVYTVLSNQEN